MNKLTAKRLSILGIVLLGASAVTAAVMPSKAKSDKTNAPNGFNDGVLTFSDDDGGLHLTCRTFQDGDDLVNCGHTETGSTDQNLSSTSNDSVNSDSHSVSTVVFTNNTVSSTTH